MPKYFKCSVCGNIVGLIVSGGGTLVCCGKNMVELEPNTVDASREKHLPVLKDIASGSGAFEGYRTVEVRVGSVDHPMTKEHYIEWIAVYDGKKVQLAKLEPDAAPSAAFVVKGGSLELYAYCNLHGLWKSSV